MNIDDFIKLAASGPTSPNSRTLEALTSGQKLDDVPFLRFDNEGGGLARISGHEGRNRALALREMGETTMPVRMISGEKGSGRAIRWGEQRDPDEYGFVEDFPTNLKSEDGDLTIDFPLGREAFWEIREAAEAARAAEAAGIASVAGQAPDVAETALDLAPRAATTEERALFRDLANAQRDIPEKAMRDVQAANGGGVVDYLAEHIGDLTHRMNQFADVDGFTGRDVARQNVTDKVDKSLGYLDSRYGIQREFDESIASNARHRGVPEAEHRAAVEAALDAYADAHAALPVYNQPQQLARDAAVALGRRDFAGSARLLRQLQEIASDESTYYSRSEEFGLKPKSR